MIHKKMPIYTKTKEFLHGGDYSPDQWLDMPEVITEDFRLMQLSGCQTFSVSIFGWSALEPTEGNYQFEWLDSIINGLEQIGAYVILSTPSGARPAWLSKKYPEVLRVGANRQRNLHGKRHNHCFTSPIYRQKTKKINHLLAERYGERDHILGWHVSNEYSGDCHCDLCQDAFRLWLQKKYQHDLDRLNKAWWTPFWSHTFSDWSEIESPAPHGEDSIHAHNLDWKRFVTDQTIDFYKNEIKPLRNITPHLPVTTNFMGDYPHMGPFTGLDYNKFAEHVDIVSWDAYPAWHNNWQSTADLASDVAFVHDLYRSIKNGQPFLILENTPSLVNWHQVNKPKRPGMHLLSALQSIAHGSDSVLYFQWRKSRGSFEKFHGAVVDHFQKGADQTRVFQEITKLSETMKKITPVKGREKVAKVAIIYDWENQWAIDDAAGLKMDKKEYIKTCQSIYKSFWKKGISVDIISLSKDISQYNIVIAPMLYMIKASYQEKIDCFVKNGGSFVSTYWSGIVDENDLCFLDGFPGPLKDILGIWVEEIDSLYDGEENRVIFSNQIAPLKESYRAFDYCEVIHSTTAQVLAVYESDYYQAKPAVTMNEHGKGKAYYIASRNEQSFQDDFFHYLMREHDITPPLKGIIPEGVSVQQRGEHLFVMNFNEDKSNLTLEEDSFIDCISGNKVKRKIELEPYEVIVLEKRI